MRDGQEERDAAFAELRSKLSDGLATAGLSKTQLAAQARLGRTTVQQAFQADAAVPPSAETVAALARVLRLPLPELLALRRKAAGESLAAPQGLGKPISEWDPYDLEIHPAGAATYGNSASPSQEALSGYVVREHDRTLSQVVGAVLQGQSCLVVLVGTSSTGKTRACWEAVQPLAVEGWRLWHPFDPTRAEAVLDGLPHVPPRTVVWLNEAQHYFGDPRTGERVAAAVHTLLTKPERGPVLILGTLWPEYAEAYTNLPAPHREDPHSRVRELLAGRTLTVPDHFDETALQSAAALVNDGDMLLAGALSRARDSGRVTQDLAGAPELLRRYQHGTPAVRAVLEAAMDARRLGVSLHLPHAFLVDAALDYLSDHDFDNLTDDWAEAAFADLARPVHGKQAPLRRTGARPKRRPPGDLLAPAPPVPATGPVFRLADYLEQHGRMTRVPLCPPASFWHAAYTHLTHPDDLHALGNAARRRHRLQWAHHLFHRAADIGNPDSLFSLARMSEEFGDFVTAETLYRKAAAAGKTEGLPAMARMKDRAGDFAGAEAAYRELAEAGDSDALISLAGVRARQKDKAGAESIYRELAAAGNHRAAYYLARFLSRRGDLADAEDILRKAIDAGHHFGLIQLGRLRADHGDLSGAESLFQEALDRGQSSALANLAKIRETQGDHAGAEEILQRITFRANRREALKFLVRMREEAGDFASAEDLIRRFAAEDSSEAAHIMAGMHIRAGDTARAETVLREAIAAGDYRALAPLARLYSRAGDQASAESILRQAADAGQAVLFERFSRLWPHGLDPDGTPTPAWR
ncbi:tetratricopeptide repeat protein [Streptomyces abikoensis]